MRVLIVAAGVLALTACNPSTTPPPPPVDEAQQADDDQPLILSCGTFANLTGASLATTYGAENVSEATLPGPEGQSYMATVLFPNDPTRRLEITWQDPATKLVPSSLSVSGENSIWSGPHSLTIGAPLADIEAANGKAFALWGFGWDYGGWVSNWNDGAFAPVSGCTTRVRFDPSASATSAQGDAEFQSDDEAVRRAAAHVAEFGISYATPQ